MLTDVGPEIDNLVRDWQFPGAASELISSIKERTSSNRVKKN